MICRHSGRLYKRLSEDAARIVSTFAFILAVLATSTAHASVSAAPTPNTDGNYTVSWTPPATIVGWYYIYESTDGGATWPQRYYVLKPATSLAFSGKAVGSYTYRVEACTERRGVSACNDIAGTATVVVNPPPPPPVPTWKSVPSTDYNGTYDISWYESPGADTHVLEQRKGSGTWGIAFQGDGGTANLPGRTAGTYSYRVKACATDPWRCSSFSSIRTVEVAPPPLTPANLDVPAIDYNGSFSISWDKSLNSHTYRYQERYESDTNWRPAVNTGSATIAHLTGKTPGDWSYRIRGCNPEICSTWSVPRTAEIPPPPDTPTGLNGPSVDHDGNYSLSWNLSNRSTTYKLWEVESNDIYSLSTTSKSLTNRPPGTWTYRVKGCNVESVCSANWSSPLPVEVLPPPVAPTDLSSVFNPDRSFTLSWNPSGGAVTYEVSELNGENWTVSEPTHTISRAPGVYTYTVRACNIESKCGGWSDSLDVNVPDLPPAAETWLPTDDSDFPDATIVVPQIPTGDTGTNSVGAVAGSGGASGGSASYQIPIAAPPGRKGMQPSASLSYSSSAGNGPVGIGWRLNTGSSISRCAATPAQDGFSANVQYDATRDRLCLNGQRLVVVSGVYGQSGAEYRTELDTFVRVRQSGSLNGSTTSFTVEHKDGRVSKYGTTAATRHVAPPRTEVLTWAIRETQDRSGNTITYDYQTFGSGEYHLSAIHYTGVNGSDGDRHVRFTYEDRGDYRTSYLAGGKTRSTKRLTTIRTEYQSRLVRQYTLNYGDRSASTGRSLLRSIEECAYLNGVDAHCLPPTSFEWQEQAPQFVAEPVTFSDPDNYRGGGSVIVHGDKRWLHELMPHGDANGDGVKDWTDLYVNAEGEITGDRVSELANCFRRANDWTLTCLEADFDADGLTDSFRQYNDSLQVRFADAGTWISTGIGWIDSGLPLEDTPIAFADFNGDGWVDIAMKQSSKLWIYFHTRSLSAPYSTAARQWLLDYPVADGTRHVIDVQVYGDMDGNGTPDLVVSNIPEGGDMPGLPVPSYIILTKSNPGGTMTTSTRPVPTTNSIWVNANFFHDLNGDSLPDILTLSGFPITLRYRLNDGAGFPGDWIDFGFNPIPMRSGTYELTPGEPQPYKYPVMSKILVMDFDGDGKDELLVAGGVVASSCSQVREADGTDTYWCDDELYGNYQASPFTKIKSPINGGVKDNSVRLYGARKFVETASGTISVELAATGIRASASQTAVIDATGDGLPDVVTALGCRLTGCLFNETTASMGGTVNPAYFAGAWINRNLGAAAPGDPNSRYEGYDLMSAAENGLGLRHEWTYRPLSSDEYDKNDNVPFYETTHAYQANDPDYFHFASSMYVVADHRVSNGVGGLNSTKYRYRGAIFNNKGRGFQGFRSIVVEEDVYDTFDSQANTDKITRTDFHQKWPLSSQVEEACTWLAVDTVADDNPDCVNVLSHTTVNAIHNVVTTGEARFVAVKTRTERTYGLNTGLLVGTSTVDRSFDAYGNVTSESRSHTDGYGTVLTGTTQVFSPDEPGWWLDKLTSRTVTYNPVSGRVGPVIAPGTDQIKAITTAVTAYDTIHRLPATVRITANDTSLVQTITTDYNDRGLPAVVTTTGTNVTGPRTVATTYTENGTTESLNGYFPFTVTNALGHENKRETDPAHGQPTRLTDPNGLVSTMMYDAFGRPSEAMPAGSPAQHVRYFWCDFTCPPGATHWVGTYSAGSPETRSYLDLIGRERQSSVRNFAGSGFVNTRTEYDKRGNKTFESQPFDPTAGESDLIGSRYLSYDALGRLQSKEQDQANGFVFLTTYSYAGLKTSINASGLLMHRIYNGLGQLVETRDAMGGFTRYGYDGAGNPIVLQDPNGHSITARFNGLGQKNWVGDPNLGEKNFVTNAVGEVLSEQDVNCPTSIGCDTVSMEYDVLGRLIERRANGVLVGSWHYDNAAPDKGIGLLDYEDNHAADGLQKHYFYSSASTGRKVLTRTIHRIKDGGVSTDYETRYYTDSYYGRPKGIRYPGGVGVAYVYNTGGYLVQEQDASSSYVLRQITARDSRNQVLQATLANGSVAYTAEYYEATGQMKSIAVAGSAGSVHALDYTYDIYGNLETQSKEYAGVTSSESFIYDDLHRLIYSSRSYPAGTAAVNYDYDPSGNLILKDDYASELRYEGPRPNAVSSLTKVGGGTVAFNYDANGNMRSGDGKSLAYNAFNKPVTITAGGVAATFSYGADLGRYRQMKSNGETTLYVDKLMEIVRVGSAIEYRHYLGEVGILTKAGALNDPAPSLRFLHRDRLGSVVTITDEAGEAEARGYDPFGKPRESDWADGNPPVLGSGITDRGFTDHEHLDDSQLIHMNGRVYDYNLGRFLSVDPIIQEPGNSQSLNPYSYIMNNPLAGVDPSGYVPITGSRIDDDYQNDGGQVTVGGQRVMTTAGVSRNNGAENSPGGPAIGSKNDNITGKIPDEIGSQPGSKAPQSTPGPEGIDEVVVRGERHDPVRIGVPVDVMIGGRAYTITREYVGGYAAKIGQLSTREVLRPNCSGPAQVQPDACEALGEVPLLETIIPPLRGARILAAARSGRAVAREISMLRGAARGKGNFGLGSATRAEAERLGRAWVGEGWIVASDGKTLLSADKLRQFRPPSFKPNLGIEQANFERRLVPEGQWVGNGHLDITQ